jgi:hypothetical protein
MKTAFFLVLIGVLLGMSNAFADQVIARVVETSETYPDQQPQTYSLIMNGDGLAACWSGAVTSCDVLLTGSWGGQGAFGNYDSGSSFQVSRFMRTPGQPARLLLEDCGPYVGDCSYSWQGVFDPNTQSFVGEISYYPATYGQMRVYL